MVYSNVPSQHSLEVTEKNAETFVRMATTVRPKCEKCTSGTEV